MKKSFPGMKNCGKRILSGDERIFFGDEKLWKKNPFWG
jgi:hypothetical protein